MKRLFLFLLLLLPLCLHAKKQGQDYIDSLAKEIPKAKNDTTRVKLLTEISKRLISVDPDKGIKYAMDALSLAEKAGWEPGKADADYSLAWLYRNKSEYIKALDFGRQSLQIWETLNRKKEMALVYQVISIIYIEQSNYPLALDNSFRSLKISEEIQDKRLIGGNLTNIGIIYDDQGDYNKALEYHNRALKQFEEHREPYTIATSLMNIGLIYSEQKEYQKALETHLKAKDILQGLGTKLTLAKNLGYIGDAYKGLKSYSKALDCLTNSLKLVEELGDKNGQAEQLQNIGLTYLAAFTDSSKNNSDPLLKNSKKQDLDSAIGALSKAATIHKEVGNVKDLSENYRDLSTAWEHAGNYINALEYHKLFMANKDSVFSQQNKIKLANLDAKRELELKDKQIQLDKANKRIESIFYIAGIVFLLLVILFIYRNYTAQIRSNLLLAKEKQVSEDLLLNILPSEVAKELRDKGSASAKNFDNVTVLLIDFVNFTSASEYMTPQELVNELDVSFKAFDNIIGNYNIEKIKTIGDAYLAVSGLPLPQVYHAENIVYAALDMIAFLDERKKTMGKYSFEARIGIHSGSVIAGIVGIKKFAYDIWGDTVNIAARMEQNSEGGKINISEATYELIKYRFNCTYRGEIDAKNKGKLGMYFINGIKPEAVNLA